MNDNSTEEHDSSLIVALRSKVIPLEYFNKARTQDFVLKIA